MRVTADSYSQRLCFIPALDFFPPYLKHVDRDGDEDVEEIS